MYVSRCRHPLQDQRQANHAHVPCQETDMTPPTSSSRCEMRSTVYLLFRVVFIFRLVSKALVIALGVYTCSSAWRSDAGKAARPPERAGAVLLVCIHRCMISAGRGRILKDTGVHRKSGPTMSTTQDQMKSSADHLRFIYTVKNLRIQSLSIIHPHLLLRGPPVLRWDAGYPRSRWWPVITSMYAVGRHHLGSGHLPCTGMRMQYIYVHV